MDDTLSQIPDAIVTRNLLPRPNWQVIATWIESNVEPVAFDETWRQLAHDWLERLCQALPGAYSVYESREFSLLATDSEIAKRVLRSCENSRRIILDKLHNVARDEGYGKHAVLLFDDNEHYYDYVSDFYPDEGEFGLSGGMFLNEGYGHFAINPAYEDNYQRVIAHELTHALLRHLPLPLWLNEGVTNFMEDTVAGGTHFIVDRHIASRHREYWNKESIHEFWSGESFYSPDDGQELSYHLANVLFRNLLSDHPKKMAHILNHANFVDAGNQAILDACSVSLADRVTQFLGTGPWATRSGYACLED